MSERIAFRMTLNPGQAAEYERRHDEIWPELARALKDAGVSDYSIWLDPETHHLFATLVRTADHTMDALPDTEIVKRWWVMMADIMETNPDNSPVQVDLKRVFQLD
ncbi:L-rhamnose mutarotase [Pelagibacterium xiamenense]|uniref:L-rhamnose mutarotase n=1 Tax=Pelagibacterium xiamenense TaxID=2901140 RepID=UPI001E6426B2|nr:L-rhamnose mutarotase [Pelagibacterium xiamenense]MCD7059742.1 L-rhamnose mutarotase [Pelagibacterium xiamenense]